MITVGSNLLDGAHVELIFKDNGKGLGPEFLGRVFDPFYTTKLGQGGSGLGMNIVYNLVTGPLRGTIALQSSLGADFCVTMVLPLKP